MALSLPAFGRTFVSIILTHLLLPGRADLATSTGNQHNSELITGHTDGDLDRKSGESGAREEEEPEENDRAN